MWDMPSGGMYTETFSVLGSIFARPPLGIQALNQITPSPSRMRPCTVAALPVAASIRNGFSAPVLPSMRPTDMVLLGATAANHRLPSRSGAASCGSEPARDVVALVQSLPLLGGIADGSCWSGLSGTSYSLNTARAASPDGRGRVVILKAPPFGPRVLARYLASASWWKSSTGLCWFGR